MFSYIPYKLAVYLTIGMLLLAFIFHFLVLSQIIPYEITWGGRLKSLKEMYLFESVSIILNGIFIGVVAMKAAVFGAVVSTRYLNYFIFAMAILFSINTIGNLFAEKNIEAILGTTFTLLLSVFCFRIASEKTEK